MKHTNLNPSERIVLGSYNLIVLSDSITRCMNVAATVATHTLITDSEEPEARGLFQILTQLRDDLSVIATDLASAAVEARTASNRPMATRAVS